ncbi:MAG: FkbM family methyltransferase [Synechococcales cyanobacterium C42_A2020_086]|nr:FkbM family methyltransferase [Synechococcales cyanobacterium C42_A2020_086]
MSQSCSQHAAAFLPKSALEVPAVFVNGLEAQCDRDLESAAAIYHQLLESQAASAPEDAMLAAALTHYELGNRAMAEQLIQQRKALNWQRSQQFQQLGSTLRQRGNLHLALAAFEHSMNLCSKNLTSLAAYYRIAHQLGVLRREIVEMSDEFGGAVGAVQFKMYYFRGKDQIVNRVICKGINAYETPLPLILSHCVHTFPGTVIDIGGNSGFFSLLAVAARASQVITFEPFPPILELLRCNIELNQFDAHVRLEPVAISDSNGVKDLYIPFDTHDLIETSASVELSFRDHFSHTLSIQTQTLDSYLTQHPIEAISFIKIDIEGHEPAALVGASQTIQQHRPLLAVEIVKATNVAFFTDFLRRNHYREVVVFSDRATLPEQVQVYPQQYNHFFVPDEQLEPRFLPMLASVGIPIASR